MNVFNTTLTNFCTLVVNLILFILLNVSNGTKYVQLRELNSSRLILRQWDNILQVFVVRDKFYVSHCFSGIVDDAIFLSLFTDRFYVVLVLPISPWDSRRPHVHRIHLLLKSCFLCVWLIIIVNVFIFLQSFLKCLFVSLNKIGTDFLLNSLMPLILKV